MHPPEHGGLIYFDYAPYGGNLRANRGEISEGVLDFIVTAPPIPALSTWASVLTGVLMLLLGTAVVRYRANRSLGQGTMNGLAGRRCLSTQSLLRTCPLLVLAALIGNARAQEATIPADVADLNVDSGVVSAQGSGSEPVVLFATTVSINDAPWIRLHFAEATLSGSPASGNASFLRVTSLLDGSAQVLNASALGDWGYTSAYMRGEEIRLELLAYRNTGNNRVRVDQASYGLAVEGRIASSPCDDVDERVPWTDVRTARFLFPLRGTHCRGISGCTAFVFLKNQNCFLTAGHCCMNMDPACTKAIVEFNVPLSQSNGTITPALAEDQYPLDWDSIQHQQGPYSIGNDWCHFGVFNNTTTGLSPYAAQGSAFSLPASVPPSDGTLMRISGYGVDFEPPPDHPEVGFTYPQTLQTDTGPFFTFPGSTSIGCVATARGGSSGGPMEHSSGAAYGIATNIACSPAPLTVLGTRVDHPDLRTALAVPYGICADCNDNTVPDAYDIFSGGSADCNGNFIPDECDIAHGTSGDCNADGVPDECQQALLYGACCLSPTPGDCIRTTACACALQDGTFMGVHSICQIVNCFLIPSLPQPGDPDP
jgi:hypothetical protein